MSIELILFILGVFFTLISGGYVFSWTLHVLTGKRIERLETNHIRHIHRHLKDECDDDCEYCS